MYYYYYGGNFDDNYRTGIEFLHAAIDVLSNIHPRMSVKTVQTFLYISESQVQNSEPDTNLTMLGRQLHMPYTSLIRHIEILGEGIPGKNGLNLVERVSFPGQRKEQYVRLTESGINLLQEIKLTFEAYLSGRSSSLTHRNVLRHKRQPVAHSTVRSPHPSDKTD